MSQRVEQPDAGRPVDADFDPLDPDYLADPYPYYARFRREAPVFYAPKIGFWVVSCYEDIVEIVKDPETFSNARVQEPAAHVPCPHRVPRGRVRAVEPDRGDGSRPFSGHQRYAAGRDG